MSKKVKSISIKNLDGFDSNDFVVACKTLGVKPDLSNSNGFWTAIRQLKSKGWTFEHFDEAYYSSAANDRFNDARNKEFDDKTESYDEDMDFPGGGFSCINTAGMSQYYIVKRRGKYYSVASNKIEYNLWSGLGDDFEVLSDIYEHSNFAEAIKFVNKDAKNILYTLTGHISDTGNSDRKQLKEEMSSDEAAKIFRKYGIKNVSSMDPEQLKVAFKQLVKKYHPDIGGDPLAMRDINAAYDVLKMGGGSPQSSFDNESEQVLEKLGEYLETELKKTKSKHIQSIKVSLTDIRGGVLVITFIAKKGFDDFGQFYLAKRGDKIKVLMITASDDKTVKFFGLNNNIEILNYITTKMYKQLRSLKEDRHHIYKNYFI
jgi:curved DNA-binding protein CbpA